MDLIDKVSSDTSVTDKQPLLTPNQAPINVVDAAPHTFHLGIHSLTPLEAAANVDDAAAKNLQSFNSAFTPFKATPAVDQCPHSMSTPERPSKKARTTSRLDKIAMFLQNEMQVVKGLRPSLEKAEVLGTALSAGAKLLQLKQCPDGSMILSEEYSADSVGMDLFMGSFIIPLTSPNQREVSNEAIRNVETALASILLSENNESAAASQGMSSSIPTNYSAAAQASYY